MLSGLRVISREEAASSLEHKAGSVEKDAGRQKHRKHERSKSTNRRSDKTRGKHAKTRKRSRTLDSSTDYSNSSGSNVKKISRSRKSHSKKGRHFSDPSSLSSDSESEEHSSLSDIKGVTDGGANMGSRDCSDAARKAAGLEWMVQAPPSLPKAETAVLSQDVLVEEVPQMNPKELNPFLKNGGDGYPEERSRPQNHMDFKAPVVGDGGLSWRLKALKRAKEQAEREGRELDKVVEERWGSLAEMTVTVSAQRAAHSHAHLHAIRDRMRDKVEDERKEAPGGKDKKADGTAEEGAGDMARITKGSRDYLRDVSVRDDRMRAPRVSDSLSWKRRKSEVMRPKDREVFQAAASALNKFENDGTFLENFMEVSDKATAVELEHIDSPSKGITTGGRDLEQPMKGQAEGMSANQLAAKALQLRLRGKMKEADELLKLSQDKKRDEELSARNESNNRLRSTHLVQPTSQKHTLKSLVGNYRLGNKESGDDGLAESILHNKQYNKMTSVEEEYDSIVDGSSKQSWSKKAHKESLNVADREAKQAIQAHKRITTQEERCQFCFGNPSRPKHLTISIATTCYLLLPPWEPLVEGHCLMAPMQHESSTRNVDENVWEELRNYKKCLLKMFTSQEKDVIFMETAMNLAQQRRHCLVECIPLPPHVAKQAPLYFKKAIDEAEDEWSQHNAKKLINTREKGLRGSIPKNFPYFHVEFGLSEGYVHVIDNEKDFKSDFGRNIVIGMLKLPEEGMHRRRKRLSYDEQKAAATDFRSSWDPYDWTKMLD